MQTAATVQTVELKVTLLAGMDSFLRVINTLRKREIPVSSAGFLGGDASLVVQCEDLQRVRTNLKKLADVRLY